MRAAAILLATAALTHALQSAAHSLRQQHDRSGRLGEPKAGVVPRTDTLLRLAKRRVAPAKKSRQRKKLRGLADLLELETDLHYRGYRYVVGSDDSGGAGYIAGPVVVASCCLLQPFHSFLPLPPPQSPTTSSPTESLLSPQDMEALGRVNDCKELTPLQRREICDIVHSHPDIFAVSVAQRSPQEIDEMNLNRATQDAFRESIEGLVERHALPFEEVYAIVDGKISPKLYASRRVQFNDASEQQAPQIFPVRPYVQGDSHIYTVALSSIVARQARDDAMEELHGQHPGFGFDVHGGYGRRDHIEAIHRLGSVEGVHRMSFKQVKGR